MDLSFFIFYVYFLPSSKISIFYPSFRVIIAFLVLLVKNFCPFVFLLASECPVMVLTLTTCTPNVFPTSDFILILFKPGATQKEYLLIFAIFKLFSVKTGRIIS